MDLETLDARIAQLPRANIGFYPTPFHALRNLSRRYGVNLFLKREDLAGPGTISGSKTRLAEFILGRALQDGYTHVITQGAYLTNSGLQFAAACRVAGLQPILFLTRDLPRHGELHEYRGNLLLNQAMGVETHVLGTSAAHSWATAGDRSRLQAEIDARREELEAQGYKVLIVPAGGARPEGFVAHALTFKEMLEQSDVELDFIYHTIGTGTALPGMLAAKLMTKHPVKFRSIAIVAYDDNGRIGPATVVERTKHVLAALDAEIPADDVIRAEIDVDQGFIGDDYAVPTEQATSAIRELAHQEGVFVGPVYTGKGFAGLLHHVRSGRIGSGSNVAFLHTGDTGNLFEIAAVVGEVAPPIPTAAAGR